MGSTHAHGLVQGSCLLGLAYMKDTHLSSCPACASVPGADGYSKPEHVEDYAQLPHDYCGKCGLLLALLQGAWCQGFGGAVGDEEGGRGAAPTSSHCSSCSSNLSS